jgi:hypothetical protein
VAQRVSCLALPLLLLLLLLLVLMLVLVLLPFSPGRMAEAKPVVLAALNQSIWFPMQTHPRRTQCGVGADERVVTNVECARARIPDAPLP